MFAVGFCLAMLRRQRISVDVRDDHIARKKNRNANVHTHTRIRLYIFVMLPEAYRIIYVSRLHGDHITSARREVIETLPHPM